MNKEIVYKVSLTPEECEKRLKQKLNAYRFKLSICITSFNDWNYYNEYEFQGRVDGTKFDYFPKHLPSGITKWVVKGTINIINDETFVNVKFINPTLFALPSFLTIYSAIIFVVIIWNFVMSRDFSEAIFIISSWPFGLLFFSLASLLFQKMPIYEEDRKILLKFLEDTLDIAE